MWISSEDARSDFILAAAAVFLGVQLVSLVTAIPGYPRTGAPFLVLSLAWTVLIACGGAVGAGAVPQPGARRPSGSPPRTGAGSPRR